MHLFKSFAALSVFLTLSVYAAPLPGYNAAVEGQAQIRDIDLDVLGVRELFDLLEERQRKGYGINKPSRNAEFKTVTGERFKGGDVYQAAKKAMELHEKGMKDRGYPKDGSGHRKGDPNDPTKGVGKSLHFPLLNQKDQRLDDLMQSRLRKEPKKPGNDKQVGKTGTPDMPKKPSSKPNGKTGAPDMSKYPGGKPTGKVGTPDMSKYPGGKLGKIWPGANRVILNKQPGNDRWNLHVSSHDHKKPIPQGTGATNNPMTAAKANAAPDSKKKTPGKK